MPPESDDDDADGDDNGDNGHTEKGGGGENALDDIADGFVDDDFLGADDESGDQSIHRNPTSSIDARQEHDRLDQSGESRDSNAGGAALASDAGDTDKVRADVLAAPPRFVVFTDRNFVSQDVPDSAESKCALLQHVPQTCF